MTKRTFFVVCLLASTGCLGTGIENLRAADASVSAQHSVQSAADQLQIDIRRIHLDLKDPHKQKYTDVSKTVEKFIPVGSSIEKANSLVLAMGCQPPFV